MNNKRIFAVAGMLILFLVTGLTFGIITAKFAAESYYSNLSGVIGYVMQQHPDLEDVLMTSLKNTNKGYNQYGRETLEHYGYSANHYYGENSINTIMVSLIFTLLLFIVMICMNYGLRKLRSKRIDRLSQYLIDSNDGNSQTLPLSKEDDFSQLEDAIYKTITTLRQTRETALIEHSSLAGNIANIAHQLKTPLTSMSLMTELLGDSISIERSEDTLYISKIQTQINRLNHLVSSMLTLAKLDAGTLNMEKREVDLLTLIMMSVDSLEPLVQARNQTITLHNDNEAHYIGDLVWSSEALMNMIKNCSEHSPSNSEIHIYYEQNPICSQIIIEDAGSGIASEDLPHLFKRFYRGESASKDSVGIGLSLAKALIERQNGTIRVENVATGGTRFIVKFYTLTSSSLSLKCHLSLLK